MHRKCLIAQAPAIRHRSCFPQAQPLGSAPWRISKETMALPTHIAATEHDPRSIAILAKTIYRELRTQGYAANEVMTLAGELLEQVASEVIDRRDSVAAHEVRAEAIVGVSG
jgi:hypothetical protein